MKTAIVTGSAGLIGSEAARFLSERGFHVVGIDNDMRKYFFGGTASTLWNRERLRRDLPRYEHHDLDIRDRDAIQALIRTHAASLELLVHSAAQPSHDWAAREPETDFSVNALGTLVLLEAVRTHAPHAVFIFTSTNKVYGDTPNRLPLVELPKRWEVLDSHPFYSHGIDESMSVDQTLHSLFGASKVAADILVQEYGRYFGLYTACFRGGCLTGPAHSGAELHGFLSYLVKCSVTRTPYTVNGYKGKQVRDNIHSFDLANMFWHFFRNPKKGEVYNVGGSRFSNCSVLEAIDLCQEIRGEGMNWSYSETNRVGDHLWWISDVRKFRTDFPTWNFTYNVRDIINELHHELATNR